MLIRYPPGKIGEFERVHNPAAAIAILAKHCGATASVIADRLENGEALRSLAYEYKMVEVQRA